MNKWVNLCKCEGLFVFVNKNTLVLTNGVKGHMGEISQGIQSMEMMSYIFSFWPLFSSI